MKQKNNKIETNKQTKKTTPKNVHHNLEVNFFLNRLSPKFKGPVAHNINDFRFICM